LFESEVLSWYQALLSLLLWTTAIGLSSVKGSKI
jgi:hypothetical protein